ncbi:hypothetical protein SLE2022_206850 [Rubroshorea leprosula]
MDTMIAQNVDYENTRGTESWEDDLYSKVKGINKGGRVQCMGMTAKSLKTTTFRVDKLKEQMEFMAKVMNDFVTGIKSNSRYHFKFQRCGSCGICTTNC